MAARKRNKVKKNVNIQTRNKNTVEDYDSEINSNTESPSSWGLPFVLLLIVIGLAAAASVDIHSNGGEKARPIKPAAAQEKIRDDDNNNKSMITRIGTFQVVETYPHDPNAFTQGLIVLPETGELLEGTGMYEKESQLREVDLKTGNVLQSHTLDGQYFGEGITHYYSNTSDGKKRRRLIFLTWRENTAFVYDIEPQNDKHNDEKYSSLKISDPIETLPFKTTTGEGWGITYRPDQHVFYVTDGSDNIITWDVNTLKQLKLTPVYMRRPDGSSSEIVERKIKMLNEIEWDPYTQTILANVWYQNVILRIQPDTGLITDIYDLNTLYTNRVAKADSFNGIALTHDYETSRELYVTGKYWPHLYRVKLKNGPHESIIEAPTKK